MKWAALVARLLVGFGFTMSALNFFAGLAGAKLFDTPPPPSADAAAYLGALGASGYMLVVKACELAGGLLLLAGRYVPLGVVLLAPVAVNIALYEVCFGHKPGPGVVFVALLAAVVAGYWPAFRGLVAAKAA